MNIPMTLKKSEQVTQRVWKSYIKEEDNKTSLTTIRAEEDSSSTPANCSTEHGGGKSYQVVAHIEISLKEHRYTAR
jgi:hypothetical protein